MASPRAAIRSRCCVPRSLDHRQQVRQRATEPVQPPDHQGVAGLQGRKELSDYGPVITRAGGGGPS
jgi:hypothetical protein